MGSLMVLFAPHSGRGMAFDSRLNGPYYREGRDIAMHPAAVGLGRDYYCKPRLPVSFCSCFRDRALPLL